MIERRIRDRLVERALLRFQSVDPFLEDAGLSQPGTGYADPSVTNSVFPGFGAAATRRVLVGGVVRF